MILHSRALGEIKVQEETTLYLPDGLLGFDELKQFALVEDQDWQPFRWLVACEEPEVGFAIADPLLFWSGTYEVPLSESDKDILDWQPGDPLMVFVIVSLPDGGRRITANLKGPIVTNHRNRLAKQVVVYNPAFSVRQPMIQPATTESTASGTVSSQRVSIG